MILPAGNPLFITTDAVGGVWSYSVALVRGLASTGQRCVLAVLGPAPGPTQRAALSRVGGCTLVETGLPLEWTLTRRCELDAVVRDLINMADACKAAAAHLHAPALACQPWAAPVVAVAHSCMATWWDAVHGGAPPREIAWHRAATQQGLLAADAAIAPSEAFAAALQRTYRLTRNLAVVHNGLPPPADPDAEREPFVLAAGRLWDRAKNIDTLDKAAAQSRHPILAAGPLGEPGGVDRRFDGLKLLGTLTSQQLRTVMARAAIFAAPSLYEPFGLAVLEAAQHGTPLILSDIPTFRELWSDAALFVPASEPAAWASAIDGLMNDAGRRMHLGRAAWARSRRYTQKAMVDRTIAIHRALPGSALRAA